MAIGQASGMAPNAAKAKTAASVIFQMIDNKSAFDSDSKEGKARVPTPYLSILFQLSYYIIYIIFTYPYLIPLVIIIFLSIFLSFYLSIYQAIN